jgi:hypothetical protein
MTQQEFHAFNFSLYKQYQAYRDNADLRKIAAVAEVTDGSILILLMLQLENFPNASMEGLEEQYYLSFSPTRNKDEARAIVSDLITRLNSFYRTVNFDRYFEQHRKLYDHAMGEIIHALPDNMFIPAMEKFYKQSFHRYIIMPSLTIPSGMAFGPSYTSKGKTYVINCFGPFARQQFQDENNINMGFDDPEHLRELSTHEFGHSFSNPVVAEIPAPILKATEHLFAPIREAMDNQGYQNWKACLYEHFVRATEVVIARNLWKQKEADELLKKYVDDRKFIYLPLIIESLEKYNKDKKAMTYTMAVMEAMEKLKSI